LIVYQPKYAGRTGTGFFQAERGRERRELNVDEPNEVRPEIRSLKTTGFGRSDVQGCLKLGVQDVEETVRKAPEEEQKRHLRDRDDGLLDCKGRCTSETLVGDTLSVLLVHRIDV
jgi:hypothetical protein